MLVLTVYCMMQQQVFLQSKEDLNFGIGLKTTASINENVSMHDYRTSLVAFSC